MATNKMHQFKVGDVVTILTRNFSGKMIVEGKATIERVLDQGDDRYSVRFQMGDRRHRFERFVDPAAQENPQDFCDRLNREMGIN